MKWTVVGASGCTVAAALLGARGALAYLAGWDAPDNTWWLRDGLAAVLAMLLAAAWAPRSTLPRTVRVAVLLPMIHLVAFAGGLWFWKSISASSPAAIRQAPLLEMLPLPTVIAVAAAATLVAGRAIAWRSRRETLHACVTLSLLHLLLLGLWLPLIVKLSSRPHFWDPNALASPVLITGILLPPFAGAVAFTAFAVRRPQAIARSRSSLAATAIVAVVIAGATRAGLDLSGALAYANFVHVLAALAIVACGALSALALSLAVRARHDRAALEASSLSGTIVGRQEPVAFLRIDDWLRGPRIASQSFEVATASGTLAIPASATIVCEPPPSTIGLASTFSTIVLRRGDRVRVAGFVAPPKDDPFRSAAGLIPGTSGIFVGAADAPSPRLSGVALAMWRPCVAYLLISLAVALPALAGALGAD